MAIIDPEGLFAGDRLRRCSDEARLYWPYLFLAANGYGRLELDYTMIARRVFVDFKKPPTELQLWAFIDEYAGANLIFLYRAGHQYWGQFFCKPGSLPRFRTSKDNKSPSPPKERYDEWIASYYMETKPLPKLSEILGKFPSGVGVGVGVGVGKKHPQPALPDEGLFAGLFPDPPEQFETQPESENERTEAGRGDPRKPSAASLEALQEHWFGEEFWPNYWRKVGKVDALNAFKKHATTESVKNKIVAAEKSHAPYYLGRNPEHRPHASTWLNRKRYDEPAEDETQPVQYRPNAPQTKPETLEEREQRLQREDEIDRQARMARHAAKGVKL